MKLSVDIPAHARRAFEADMRAELRLQERAAVDAINRVARGVRTRSARAIAHGRGLPVRLVNARVRIRKATRARPEARVWIGTYAIKLSRIGKPRQTKKGATAGKRPIIPSAFVATMPSGHTGVFKRRGGARLPIDEQQVQLMPAAEQVLRLQMAAAKPLVQREFARRLAILRARTPRR